MLALVRRAGGLFLILAISALLAAPACAEVQTFTGIGPVPFTMPPDVWGLHVEGWGAAGGAGSGYTARPGGSGALAYGNLALSPGTGLYVVTGGQGGAATASVAGSGG